MMRSLLGWMARRAPLRKMALSTPGIRDLAWRFVAGDNLEDGVAVVRSLNGRGIAGSLNPVGTHVYREEEAVAAARAAIATVERIRKEQLRCHLSLKLTQVGLDIDERLCRAQLHRVLEAAQKSSVFVRIDMEESRYVECTLELFEEARSWFGPAAVGIALQSYLRGRESDLERLLVGGSRIRLVKGGYWERPEAVVRAKAEIDRRFEHDLEQLMARASDPAIATHDPYFIRRTLELAQKFQRGNGDFEFQMLYGVRPDLQAELVENGFRVRCYVPFGGEWFTYFLGCVRRLPEGLWRQQRSNQHAVALL